MLAETISARDLVSRYDALLLDAYGVLVDAQGTLPHAAEFVQHLATHTIPHAVVSNDASRLPHRGAARYQSLGLPIATDRCFNSGSLIGPYFAEQELGGSRTIVLGPDDSITLVRDAGGVVAPFDDPTAQVVVVCDDEGFPFVEATEQVIGTLYARLDSGQAAQLVLPNPDLIVPKPGGSVGLTAGSIAVVIEAALNLRYGPNAPKFVQLGKPHPKLFHHAIAALGLPETAKVAMVGDQLATDIAGSHAAGIDSVLVKTGLGGRQPGDGVRPTWLLDNLAL